MPVAGLANGLPWACSGAGAGFPRETRDLLAGGARQPQCLKPRACFGAQQLDRMACRLERRACPGVV
jgi:hypothetical protein